jgi:cyclase
MTAAVENPDLVGEAAVKIGSANLVLAIDARQRPSSNPQAKTARSERKPAGRAASRRRAKSEGEAEPSEVKKSWEICTHGGRRPTGIDAVGWAERMARAGAGEILLTSMDRDGTKSGYDLELLRAVADAVGIPVIASGGGGSAEDLAAALDDGPEGGHCQAALAASIFHFHETTVSDVKLRLRELGIPVRLPPVDAQYPVR